MQPINKTGYLLQHVSFVLSRQADQALQEQLGIGFSQYKILMMLQWNPATQQRQIAEHLGQTEASISRQIKLLLDKGLLSSRVSPKNRRIHLTTPTTKGIHMTEAARAVLQGGHGEAFADLSEKQQKQLTELLIKVHDFACQPGKTAACDHPLKI